MSDHTPIEDKLYSEAETPEEVPYPSAKATLYFNQQQLLKSKARLACDLHDQITKIHAGDSNMNVKAFKALVKSLRPPMRVIKQQYRRKGEPEHIIDLLVTSKNYPYLPSVWLTLKQFKALLDIADGRPGKWTTFVDRKFLS